MTKLFFQITQTLRGRLALWYFASVGLIFLLVTMAVGYFLRFTLLNQIDHHLHIAVNEAKQITENYQSRERDGLIKNLVSGQGMTVVVLSPDGAPVLETNSPDTAVTTEHELQKIMLSRTLHESEPAHFTAGTTRFAAIPASVKAGKGIVAVGYSTSVIYAASYRLILILFSGLIFLAIPLTILGYRLLKKYLSPLESIARQAKAITPATLSRRLHTPHATRELMTIQSALNQMLSQLEQVFIREREFFSDAAHTLKTPLARLRAELESLSLPSAVRQELEGTINEASDTVEELLYLSKLHKSVPATTKLNLSELVRELSELAIALGAAKKLDITTKIEPSLHVVGNRKVLARALGNLVQNAVLYNRSHGKISLTLKQQDKQIILVIADTGAGISKTDLPRVFDRFYRGRGAQPVGSGLGLAIALAGIQSLGGTLTLSSTAGRGTKAVVSF